jgi:hypothetical protein
MRKDEHAYYRRKQCMVFLNYITLLNSHISDISRAVTMKHSALN